MRESAELAKSEVAGMDGYDVEELSLRLGVAESFDSIDLFNRHFHVEKFSSVISGSDLHSLAPRHTRSTSSMQWVLPSRSARRPSARSRRLVVPQVIWAHQAREGKVGENPLTYKEALRKEKVRKNLWQDVRCRWRSIDIENDRMAGFCIQFPLAGHTTRQQWRNLTRTANGYSRKFS